MGYPSVLLVHNCAQQNVHTNHGDGHTSAQLQPAGSRVAPLAAQPRAISCATWIG